VDKVRKRANLIERQSTEYRSLTSGSRHRASATTKPTTHRATLHTAIISAGSKEPWINYVNLTGQEQVELVGELAAAWSKLEEYAARLALIVHLVRTVCGDADPAIVDEESMLSGITLATWFKGEAKRVYGLMSESPDEADERRLVEWVAARGGEVTAREVQMGCRWLRDPGAAEKALCELAKVGLGEWVQSPSGRRGQPTRRFRMSAPSTVNGNGVLPEEIGNTVDVDTVGTRGIKDPDAANDAFAGAAAGSAGDRGTTSDTDLAA